MTLTHNKTLDVLNTELEMSNELQKTLQRKYGFWEFTAKAFIESKGKCGYCDENLYKNRLRYYSMQLDHLLPKNQYINLANHPNNFVLACQRCNNLKRTLDVLVKGEDPESMLLDQKSELISRVKKYLNKKIAQDQILLNKLHKLLSW